MLKFSVHGNQILLPVSFVLVQAAMLKVISLVITAVTTDEAVRPPMALKLANAGCFVGANLPPLNRVG